MQRERRGRWEGRPVDFSLWEGESLGGLVGGRNGDRLRGGGGMRLLSTPERDFAKVEVGLRIMLAHLEVSFPERDGKDFFLLSVMLCYAFTSLQADKKKLPRTTN